MRHEKTELGAIKKYNWIFRNTFKDEQIARRIIENYPIITDDELHDLKAFYKENKYKAETIAKWLYGDVFIDFYTTLISNQIVELLTLESFQYYTKVDDDMKARFRNAYRKLISSLKSENN